MRLGDTVSLYQCLGKCLANLSWQNKDMRHPGQSKNPKLGHEQE
jgi:hypothetical protein